MRQLLLAPILALALSAPARAQSLLQPNDTIAICGDSITDQRLYSEYIEAYLLMCLPHSGQTFWQLGWSGESAPGFLNRLNSDLYTLQPSVVTTSYGMNDGRYGPLTPAIAQQYTQAQTAIVQSLQQHHIRTIVLGSAKCVDTATYTRGDPQVYNETLKYLASIDRNIARQENVIYAPVYETTTDAMQKAKAAYGDNYDFAGRDGIHPGPNGQLVIAYAFLKSLGCTGAIATIQVDLATNRASATPGHRILSCRDGAITIESTRYPFCFDGNPDTPDQNQAAILPYVPFNQDLNRYLLVVQGLTTPNARVTWGANSKIFTRDQLTAGINLAAEFIQGNPFTAPFHTVMAKINTQQTHDADLIKQFLHYLPYLKTIAPRHQSALDDIAQEAIQNTRAQSLAATAAVLPVRHTITITPLN